MEIVTSETALKYLYESVFEGSDIAAIYITNTEQGDVKESVMNHNEIKDHIEARYVEPSDAVWRIFDKK